MKLIARASATLMLTLFGMLGALLIVEVGVRLVYDYLPHNVQSMVRHVGVSGVAKPVLGPSWFETCVGDQRLSAKIRPSLVNHKTQFGPAIYHVNTATLGFRDVGFRVGNDATQWDGVVVGDSFSFCHHVDYEHCWVPQVAALSGVQLANLAIPATGSVSHSRYLEEYGRQLRPRIVLWQYWVNDAREDVEHIMGDFVPCPRAGTGADVRPPNLSWRQLLKYGSISANLVQQSWSRYFAAAVEHDSDAQLFETTQGRVLFAWRGEGSAAHATVAQSGFEMTTGAIALAASRTKRDGGRFLLIVAPSNLQIYAPELPTKAWRAEATAEDRMSDRLIEFAHAHEIEYLDLRPVFLRAAARGEVLYPDYDVHWTARGNAIAATAISAWINEGSQ